MRDRDRTYKRLPTTKQRVIYERIKGQHLFRVQDDNQVITITEYDGAEAFTDMTPDQFTFTDQTNVLAGTIIYSNIITVSGINLPTSISIGGGQYSVNGGAYTSVSGTVVNGDTVRVRQTSSSSYTTTTDVVLTIGGVSDTFSVTTSSAPINWNAFDKSANIDLTNNSLTASINGDISPYYGAVRATTPRGSNTGNWYFEILLNSGGSGYIGLGVASATHSLNQPGTDASAQGAGFSADFYFHDGAWNSHGTSYGQDNITTGDGPRYGIGWNSSTGATQVFLNGMLRGTVPGPATTGPVYPMLSLSPYGSATGRFTRADMPSVPAGYQPWDGT